MIFTLSFFMFKNKIAHLQEEFSLLQCRRRRSSDKKNQKYYIAIDEYERRIIINSLNNLRNKLIAGGGYTNAVEDILVKVANAPIKKFKVRITEV